MCLLWHRGTILMLIDFYCNIFQMSGSGNFSVAMNAGQQQIQPPRRGVMGKISMSSL